MGAESIDTAVKETLDTVLEELDSDR